MEFRLVVSAPPDSHVFELWIEPEGMMYELPATSKVVLSFRGRDAMTVELCHRLDGVVIWRPPDTEVWATLPDGACGQIAGWLENPFPGLDSGAEPTEVSGRVLVERLFHDADPPTIDGKRLGPGRPR